MTREVLYKCTFCGKFEESNEQKFVAIGSNFVGEEFSSKEYDLCKKCYKLFRKVLKLFSSKELYQIISTTKFKQIEKALKSSLIESSEDQELVASEP